MTHNESAQAALKEADIKNSSPTPFKLDWSSNGPPIIFDADGKTVAVLSTGHLYSGAMTTKRIIANAKRLLHGNSFKKTDKVSEMRLKKLGFVDEGMDSYGVNRYERDGIQLERVSGESMYFCINISHNGKALFIKNMQHLSEVFHVLTGNNL